MIVSFFYRILIDLYLVKKNLGFRIYKVILSLHETNYNRRRITLKLNKLAAAELKFEVVAVLRDKIESLKNEH